MKDLTDIWRNKHPDSNTFTWKKPNINSLVMSHLDFFLVSRDFALTTNSVEIKTRYISDHSRVVLNLDFSENKRGKGYWKFNNTHLRDKNFVELINQKIQKFKYDVKNANEQALDIQWENLKKLLADTAKKFSIQKAQEKSRLIERLENKIILLDKKLVEANSDQDKQKINKQIKKMEEFLMDEHEEKVQAARFRSRAQYYLEGEKNTAYFFGLEKTRYNSKILNKIKREDGSIISDPKNVLREQKIFYERLYKKKPVGEWGYKNEDPNTPKLSESEKEIMDRDLSDEELAGALMGMANSKTPGLDGLSADFY